MFYLQRFRQQRNFREKDLLNFLTLKNKKRDLGRVFSQCHLVCLKAITDIRAE